MELTREELLQMAALAEHERFCPSAAVLMEKEHGAELQEHLGHCARCRSRLESSEILAGELAFEKLADMFNEDIFAQTVPQQVEPGQVWQLGQSYGGWGAYACYYHAPQVLVLDVLPYDVARVAHISSFGALKHQGDISLTDDSSDCFAEFWNVYSVPTSWLDVYVGKVRAGLIAAGDLLFHAQQEQEGPEEGSPIDMFRQHELFHSMHFAMKAMSTVMELTETYYEEQQRQEIAKYLGKLGKEERWSPVSVVARDDSLYAVAAASAMLKLEFGEGDERNVCLVEYDDGQLSYSFDYIPSHTTYAVMLLLDDVPVSVKNEQGEESTRVIVDSDAAQIRHCGLDEQDFNRCTLLVFQNTGSPR